MSGLSVLRRSAIVRIARTIVALAFASSLVRWGSSQAASPPAFAFPRDHGAHEAERDEWWRWVGHLRARDGRRFDYAMTFFRFAMGSRSARGPAPWQTRDIFPATLTLVDESTGRFVSAERFARDALGLGKARAERLSVRVIDWTLDGSNSSDPRSQRFTLHGTDGTNGVDLRSYARKAAVSLPAGGGAHAYALTSLATSGSITFEGRRIAVTGTSWFDHTYGTNARGGVSGWDRFAVVLDDGREIWLDVTRTENESDVRSTRALLVSRDGSAHELGPGAYSFGSHSPSGWRSRATGVRYPNIWALTIPSARLMVSFEPVVAAQEIVANGRGVSYWNGAVDVYDITPGTPGKRLGAGYVELTGYARPLRL